MEYKITEVVAALIWDNDRFMICQRPANKARGMLWEFVGGKVEPGETKQQALIRECQEELAVTLAVGDEFMEVIHEYPDITVRLSLFHATIEEGVPQKLEHNDIQWITVAEIPNYQFCPADVEILKKIEDYSREEKLKDSRKYIDQRLEIASQIANKMVEFSGIKFSDLKPSMLPDGVAGVYAITNFHTGEVLYVGRTKNLRQRLYYNHLMGPQSNARLKKYLVEDENETSVTDMEEAKSYLKEHCWFQYIKEPDVLKRGQIEGLLSFLLNVKYMYEEH